MENAYHIPGVILLDGFSHSFLQGIILTQISKYWSNFPDDSRCKRFFVAGLVLLVMLQTVVEDYKVWRLTISQDWWTSSIQWSDIFLDGLICSLCEAFFIRRCWKVTNKRNWILLPLCLLCLSTIVANIYLAVTVQETKKVSSTQDTFRTARDMFPSTIFAFSYWTFGTFVLDISITSILAFCLWRKRTGLVESDRVVYDVIAISWESTALPSLFMLTAVSIYHARPGSHYYLIRFFALATGKLYSIGLLRTLNSRVKLRERMKSHDLGRVSLGGWQCGQTSSVSNAQSLHQLPPIVQLSYDAAPVPTRSYSVTSRTGVSPHDVSFGSPNMDARERGSAGHAHSDE